MANTATALDTFNADIKWAQGHDGIIRPVLVAIDTVDTDLTVLAAIDSDHQVACIGWDFSEDNTANLSFKMQGTTYHTAKLNSYQGVSVDMNAGPKIILAHDRS